MQKIRLLLFIAIMHVPNFNIYGQSVLFYGDLQRKYYHWDYKETRERTEYRPSFGYELGIGKNIKKVDLFIGFSRNVQFLRERVPNMFISGSPSSAIIVYDYKRKFNVYSFKIQSMLWKRGDFTINYVLGMSLSKISYSEFLGTARNGTTLDTVLYGEKGNSSNSLIHQIGLSYEINKRFSVLLSPAYEFKVRLFKDVENSFYIRQDSRYNFAVSLGFQYKIIGGEQK